MKKGLGMVEMVLMLCLLIVPIVVFREGISGCLEKMKSICLMQINRYF